MRIQRGSPLGGITLLVPMTTRISAFVDALRIARLWATGSRGSLLCGATVFCQLRHPCVTRNLPPTIPEFAWVCGRLIGSADRSFIGIQLI